MKKEKLDKYYFYCPKCCDMKNLTAKDFKTTLEVFDDEEIVYFKCVCEIGYQMLPSTIPMTPEAAYEYSISVLTAIEAEHADKLVSFEETLTELEIGLGRARAKERLANGIMFTVEKAIKDIRHYIKEDWTDDAIDMCTEFLGFIKKHKKDAGKGMMVEKIKFESDRAKSKCQN